MQVAYAAFLGGRGRADEAAALAGQVRAAFEGKGAGLLEKELETVEALLATARAGPAREPG